MGPQGCGKGTQGQLLADALDVAFLGMGDLFRRAAAEPGELGREISAFMERGDMVPDKYVIEALVRGVHSEEARDGFVLDGYPRRENQVDELDQVLDRQRITKAILLDVSLEEAMQRVAARRVCTNVECGAIYSADSPAASRGRCDRCTSHVVARSDDQPDALKRRYEHYEAHTVPAIRIYEGRGLLARVDGNGDLHEVHQRVLAAASAASSLGNAVG
jgi:adenylate kinase